MSDLMAQSARLNSAAQTLVAYANGDACQALVEWINALLMVYQDELLDVSPEDLKSLQAQVRQLLALKTLVRGEVQTNGRI
jgi:hypothetical protein